MILLATNPAITQTPEFGQKYKVKVGNHMQYEYTKVLYHNKRYFPAVITLVNGSTIPINITTGIFFTESVTLIDISTDPSYPLVYLQAKFSIPGKGAYVENQTLVLVTSFLIMAFDNKTIVNQFVTYSNEANNGTVLFKADNTFIYYQSNFTFGTFFSCAYNWHTGWMDYSDYKYINEDNTTTEIKIDRYNGDFVLTVNQGFLLVFLIVIPIILSVLELISWKKYKKEERIEPRTGKQQSYISYVKQTVKMKKNPQKRKPNISIDKSLKTIEDILKELDMD